MSGPDNRSIMATIFNLRFKGSARQLIRLLYKSDRGLCADLDIQVHIIFISMTAEKHVIVIKEAKIRA